MTPGQPKAIHTRQLAVDMYDSAKHSLVWRALVSKTIDPEIKAGETSKESPKGPCKAHEGLSPRLSIRSYAPESHYERVAHVMHSATLAG
jgi:hypothetical protein